MTALEDRARAIGYHKLVLAAFPTHAAGRRLDDSRGFRTVGIDHEPGQHSTAAGSMSST